MARNHNARICAAGMRPKDPNTVGDLLSYYPLEDKVNALLNDRIEPPKPSRDHRELKYKYEQRTKVADLVNPPIKSKFEHITQDLKDTVFASYWKKRLGKSPDHTSFLPDGFDLENNSFGKKIEHDEVHGFDLLYPKDKFFDTPKSQQPGVQTNRNYCAPSFNKDLTYGLRCKADNSGNQVKCCMQQDEIYEGKAGYTINCEARSNFQDRTLFKPGRRLPANDNFFNDVHPPLPKGFTFGKQSLSSDITECLTDCYLNPEVKLIRECLAHINVVRKNNKKKWKQDPYFSHGLFEKLKWLDINHSKIYSKWLPREVVYANLSSEKIVVAPNLVEPLLKLWHAFDGKNIEYRTLLRLVNFREPIPELPKMCEIEPSCLDFRTTYKEMTKPGQCIDQSTRSAGMPTVRMDMDYPVTPEGSCNAYRVYLGDETDVRCCINPSLMTQYNITHRDMYTKREPKQLRMIFEKAGRIFTDEEFNKIWLKAMEYHPDGIVCIETFKKAANITEKQ